MRLLRLELDQDALGIDLHPFLTVVHGLDVAQQARLLHAVRTVARGSSAGVRGLVQDNGRLVELDGSAGRFDRSRTTSADVVIDTAVSPMKDLPELQARIDQVRRRYEIDAVRVEEVRADIDPSARATVVALEARLTRGSSGRLDRSSGLAARIEQALAHLDQLDTHLRRAPDGVLALRQRWERYLERVGAATEHFRALEMAVIDAEAQVKQARQAVVLAEQAARPLLLTRDEEARLELLSFPGGDRSRRGRWRKALRPEEQAEMNELLAKVGVESWTAYTVHRSTPVVPADKLAMLAKASQAEEEALVTLENAREQQKRDPLMLEFNHELLDIRNEARSHLGLMLPPDLGRALAELVEEWPNPAWAAAARQLHQILAEAGVLDWSEAAGAGDPDVAGVEVAGVEVAGVEVAVVEKAREWLAARRREVSEDDTNAVRAQLARAEARLHRHQRALARLARDQAAAAASARELAALEAEAGRRITGQPLGVEAITAQIDLVAAQVAVDGCGSVPVVVTGSLAALDERATSDLLEHLARLSTGLQVVVLTEGQAAASWAGAAGLSRALVTGPRQVVVAGTAPMEPTLPDRAPLS